MRLVFLPDLWLGAGRWRCILRGLMSAIPARKCLCCQEKFHPDARNRRHQQFCSKDDCRKASKAARQARWLAKPENRDYYRDSANCERVRLWRLAHPGYSRRKTTSAPLALQDVLNPQPAENEHPKTSCSPSPQALALYLFLCTVADAQGASYYSDSATGKLLAFSSAQLREARSELIAAGLIAHQAPFYQVLSLEPIYNAPPASTPPPRAGEILTAADILRAIMEVPK